MHTCSVEWVPHQLVHQMTAAQSLRCHAIVWVKLSSADRFLAVMRNVLRPQRRIRGGCHEVTGSTCHLLISLKCWTWKDVICRGPAMPIEGIVWALPCVTNRKDVTICDGIPDL